MITVEKYYSYDGKEFDTYPECIKYETENNIDPGVKMYGDAAIELTNDKGYNSALLMHVTDIQKASKFFEMIQYKTSIPPTENGYFCLNLEGKYTTWDKISKELFDFLMYGPDAYDIAKHNGFTGSREEFEKCLEVK